jgi:hypothetical protein
MAERMKYTKSLMKFLYCWKSRDETRFGFVRRLWSGLRRGFAGACSLVGAAVVPVVHRNGG